MVAKKNEGGGGKPRRRGTGRRGASPRGAAAALQGPDGGSGLGGLARSPPLCLGWARPAFFRLWMSCGKRVSEGTRKPSNPFSCMRLFLGRRRPRRLIRRSLVCMRPARVELALHFRVSSHSFASPHYLFLENGVVLPVFSFSACTRASPLPRSLDRRRVYFRGWSWEPRRLLDKRQKLARGGNERFGKRSERDSAPSVCLLGRAAGASPLAGVGGKGGSAAATPLDAGGPLLTPCAPAGSVGRRPRPLQRGARGRRHPSGRGPGQEGPYAKDAQREAPRSPVARNMTAPPAASPTGFRQRARARRRAHARLPGPEGHAPGLAWVPAFASPAQVSEWFSENV